MKNLLLCTLAILLVVGSSIPLRADGKENTDANSAAAIIALKQRVAALERELAELKAEKGISTDNSQSDTEKTSVADEVRRRRATRDAAQSGVDKRELDPETRKMLIAEEVRRRRAEAKAAEST